MNTNNNNDNNEILLIIMIMIMRMSVIIYYGNSIRHCIVRYYSNSPGYNNDIITKLQYTTMLYIYI